MLNFIAVIATLSGALLSSQSCFAADAVPTKISETSKGKMLTDQKGMTLYVFDKDAAGKSNCSGGCATLWPALSVTADATASGDYKIITRDDGSKQWAYKSKPLYTWSKDEKPGDTTGDGFNNNIWHIATP